MNRGSGVKEGGGREEKGKGMKPAGWWLAVARSPKAVVDKRGGQGVVG